MISGKEVEVWPVTFCFNQFLLRSDVRTRAYFLKKTGATMHPVIYIPLFTSCYLQLHGSHASYKVSEALL